MLVTSCVKLPNTLNISSTNKMIAAIIQPRLLRGRGAGGEAMTGGGGSGGGVPASGGVFISIVRASYRKAGRAANANPVNKHGSLERG